MITNISYDHTNLLGNTLEKIAAEKAGIIKSKIPVVISETQEKVKQVFIDKAKANKSEIYFADKLFVHKEESYFPEHGNTGYVYKNRKMEIAVLSDLPGTYQKYNIGGVLTVIDILKKDFKIKEVHIYKALKKVKKLTGLHGRWEILNEKNPRIICDTGHNKDGIMQVMDCIDREFTSKVVKGNLHVVFGAVGDKDVSEIFSLLKANKYFSSATYYFCKPNIPRGMEVKALHKEAVKKGLRGEIYPSVKEALKAAKKTAKVKELVFIGGSTFTVAEVV